MRITRVSTVVYNQHLKLTGPAPKFAGTPLIERLYCDLAVDPFGGWNEPVKAHLALATGPGLGVDPDEAVLERCRVG
jgi:hypothetical protein